MCEHQHIITMLDPQQTQIDPSSSNQVKTNVNSNADCDGEQSRAFEAVRKLAIEKLSAMVASLHQVEFLVPCLLCMRFRSLSNNSNAKVRQQRFWPAIKKRANQHAHLELSSHVGIGVSRESKIVFISFYYKNKCLTAYSLTQGV